MRADRGRMALAMAMVTLCAGVAAAADAPRVPQAGSVRRLVVSIPDRKLALIENDTIVSVFPVAVGSPDSPSPVGTFTIVNRIPNPTYYRPGKIVGPGAANPLGTRWIGLNEKGYGIHGTDQPRSIGFPRSHGCIRLRNRDVERLFERVRPGDIVELYAERTPQIALLFLEKDTKDTKDTKVQP
jgi:lipoprotein-anchoring transpeptidase ErfK/SrfK